MAAAVPSRSDARSNRALCLRAPGPFALALAGLVALGALAPVSGQSSAQRVAPGEATAGGHRVDFESEVEPILSRHCHRCHGPQRQENELRLDRREAARRGGLSGLPLLTEPEESELYRRLVADDPEVRMPRGRGGLTTEEIAVVERWLEQGASWPEPGRFRALWSDELPAVARRVTPLLVRSRPVVIPVALAVLALLVFERLRPRHRTETAKAGERPRNRSARIGWYLALVSTAAALGLAMMVASSWRRFETLEQSLSPPRSRDPSVLPIVEPRHPPRLGGRYYRGNDERNPELFNNGFYTTSIFDLELVDRAGEALAWGDAVRDRAPIAIRLRVTRAPFATPMLFEDKMMLNSFVSELRPEEPIADLDRDLARAEILESGERWQYRFPISLRAGRRADTTLYLYQGTPRIGELDAGAHYGIVLALELDPEGRIAADSTLWMGSTYHTSNIATPPPNRVPIDEWFDFRPMPMIDRDQSHLDRHTLGVQEHRGEEGRHER